MKMKTAREPTRFFLLLSFVIISGLWNPRSHSLKITGLGVPKRVRSGERVRFSCNFRLEGHTLHSLTWTKDDLPFFRYRYGDELVEVGTNSSRGPDAKKKANLEEPIAHKLTYDVPGITVDMQGSTLNEVSLSRVDHRASGTIGCWLRALQYNHTDEQDSNITVIDPPKHAPLIEGKTTGYELDEMLKLNCTSPPAHPPAVLDWTINGQEAAEGVAKEYPGVPDGEGRTSSIIGLRFRLFPRNFVAGGVLMIRCKASLMGDPGLVSQVIILEQDVRKGRPRRQGNAEQNTASRHVMAGVASLAWTPLLLLCYYWLLLTSSFSLG